MELSCAFFLDFARPRLVFFFVRYALDLYQTSGSSPTTTLDCSGFSSGRRSFHCIFRGWGAPLVRFLALHISEYSRHPSSLFLAHRTCPDSCMPHNRHSDYPIFATSIASSTMQCFTESVYMSIKVPLISPSPLSN